MWFNEDDYDDDSPTSASSTAAAGSASAGATQNASSGSASALLDSAPVTSSGINPPIVNSENALNSNDTPLAQAAAVAAAAGTAVGFVPAAAASSAASNLTSTSATNQQQQCSSVTSTGLSSGDLGAKNTVFSEVSNVAGNDDFFKEDEDELVNDGIFCLFIGKQGDKANEGKVSPNNMKKVRFQTFRRWNILNG